MVHRMLVGELFPPTAGIPTERVSFCLNNVSRLLVTFEWYLLHLKCFKVFHLILSLHLFRSVLSFNGPILQRAIYRPAVCDRTGRNPTSHGGIHAIILHVSGPHASQ